MANNNIPAWVDQDVAKATRAVPKGHGLTVKLEGKTVSICITKMRLGGDRDVVVRELKKLGWSARSNAMRKWVEATKRVS